MDEFKEKSIWFKVARGSTLREFEPSGVECILFQALLKILVSGAKNGVINEIKPVSVLLPDFC